MEDQKTKEKRTPRLDRIVLDATTLAVVAKVQSQIEAVFNGLVKLTNKDVVNYLVQCRTSELSGQELDVLRQTHFDEVKAAKWAVERLQAARSAGEALNLMDLFAMLQTPHVKKKRRSKLGANVVLGETTHRDSSTIEARSKANDKALRAPSGDVE